MWFCESCACECVGSVETEQTKPQVALILVELCCQENSGLKSVNTAFGINPSD